MTTTNRNCLDAAFYFVLFFLFQICFNVLTAFGFGLFSHSSGGATSAIVSSSLSSVATIGMFAWRRWTVSSRDFLRNRPSETLPWVVPLAVGVLVPLSLLQDVLGLKMDDELQAMFVQVVHHDLGYVVLALLAPVAEEMVFRGAVLAKLLEAMGERRRWLAIAVSALLFGVAHGNLAQGLNAVLTGLLLGWMYCRTRSVVPGIVFHWVNNTSAFVLMRLIPQSADMTIVELYGGDWLRVALATGFSVAIFAASLYQLQGRLRQ